MAQSTRTSYSKALAKIHIAKKAVGWLKDDDLVNDETYRQMLERVTGLTSTAGMSATQHKDVLTEFKHLGWTPKKPKTKVNKDWRAPRIKYIKGMWTQLGALSALNKPGEDGLNAFCKKFMKGEKLEWSSSYELNRIVEALKAWLAREIG